jgi:hypothetical protein
LYEISASTWNCGPSARICAGWAGRKFVLSAASGGIEMKYCAHGEALAASFVARRSQSSAV